MSLDSLRQVLQQAMLICVLLILLLLFREALPTLLVLGLLWLLFG